jgi:hypothetical protein
MSENQSVAPPTSGVPNPAKTKTYTRQSGEAPRARLFASRIVNRLRHR